MSTPARAFVVHSGEVPACITRTQLNLQVTESVSETEFTKAALTDGFEIPAVDVVLVSVGVTDESRHGLGVEGAFAHSNIPVVAVSDSKPPATVTQNPADDWYQAPRFDAHLTPDELQSSETQEWFDALLAGYQQVATSVETTQDVVKLLDIPQDATHSTIPTPKLKHNSWSGRDLARWIRFRFLATPGLVVNATRAANRLGLTVNAFREYAERFQAARYDGVFADSEESRWWLPTVHMIAVKDDSIQGEQARCLKCGEPDVERAAWYEDDVVKSLQPVHRRCSRIERTEVGPYLNVRTVHPDTATHETASGMLY